MKKLTNKFEALVLPSLQKVIDLYKDEFKSETETLEAIQALGFSCEYLMLDVQGEEKWNNNKQTLECV